jgi:mannose-6-phosphate isomerase-like protein (cupin superfamily)
MFVQPLSELRRSETACLFQGGDRAPVSVFVTEYTDGRGPDLHLHPYPEVFYVEEGVGEFTAGDERQEVAGGHFVVVPAETPHGFKQRGDGRLRVVTVHPSPEVVQTDL